MPDIDTAVDSLTDAEAVTLRFDWPHWAQSQPAPAYVKSSGQPGLFWPAADSEKRGVVPEPSSGHAGQKAGGAEFVNYHCRNS